MTKDGYSYYHLFTGCVLSIQSQEKIGINFLMKDFNFFKESELLYALKVGGAGRCRSNISD